MMIQTVRQKRIGGQVLDSFEKVVHSRPMLSLDDIFSLDELEKWLRKIKDKYPKASFFS